MLLLHEEVAALAMGVATIDRPHRLASILASEKIAGSWPNRNSGARHRAEHTSGRELALGVILGVNKLNKVNKFLELPSMFVLISLFTSQEGIVDWGLSERESS